jgi:hypothetical protein
MPGAGDYVHYRQMFSDRTKDTVLAATDSGKTDLATVKNANHRLYIQKISYNPITAHATAIVFQDDAGTPVKIGTVPASQTTPIVFDYGPKGRALTLGKNLDASQSGAGPAGDIHVECYERMEGVTYDNSGASLQ